MKLSSKKKSIYFVILLLLFLINCKQSNKANNDELAKLAKPTVNKAVIDSIDSDIKSGQYGLIDRFIIIQHDSLIADYKYEQDYENIAKNYDTTNHQYNYNHPKWHPYYKETDLHTLQSVTKSITSALLGIALEENPEFNVQTKVVPLLKDYLKDTTDIRKNSITIKDLLTMRSGLEWDEKDYTNPKNDCIILEGSNDWISYVINKPTDTIPGTYFEYNSGASVLLGKLVRIISGTRIDKYAEEKLFKPLNITDYYWKQTPKDEIDTEGGLYLKSEDLAKIGLLFLNNGKWNNNQLISKNWVTSSIHPFVTKVNPNSPRNLGYGYQWWVPKHKNDVAEIFAGNGYGGQFLFVVPEHDLIVVFNGWNINEQPKKSTWFALEDRLLPSIVNN